MERKNPYESNNGLRATDRTNQSISLAWPPISDAFSSIQLDQSETEIDDKNEDVSCDVNTLDKNESEADSQLKAFNENRRASNWFEVQMKKGEQAADWIPIYRGHGCTYKLDDLPPDSLFLFRMKNHTDDDWGTEVTASTTPAPASAEDLNRAVEMNSEYLVSRILKLSRPIHLRKILIARDRNGMTALMVACHIGNVNIAERLIRAGCDINAESSESLRTPLMFACIKGHQNAVTLLDQHKAVWSCRDKSGSNTLDLAIIGGYVGILKVAVSRLGMRCIREKDRRHGWTPLMRAAIQSDNLDIVRFLVSKGADLNSTDQYKNKSVLAAAILGKKPSFVKFLLAKGANPFFENENGKNCLQMARILGYREITEIINEHINSMGCSKN